MKNLWNLVRKTKKKTCYWLRIEMRFLEALEEDKSVDQKKYNDVHQGIE